ncbi:MAG: hypothetical protein CSA07_00645 [Bacteroidia bacterium]|nr:MAG: hypothetical protein CSA07_00645 [Bacteroidia bacterium]
MMTMTERLARVHALVGGARGCLLALLLGLGVLLPLASHGQMSKIEQANAFYRAGGYMSALPLYKEVMETVNKDELGDYLFKIGECYRLTGQYRQATIWYHKSILRDFRDPKVHLYYAQCLLAVEKYDEAKVEFENYKKLMPNDERAANGLESVELAKSWSESPTGYKIRNMRSINSKYNDYGPVYGSKDYRTLFFTSSREEATGKKYHAGTGEKFSDIFVSLSNGAGRWSKPQLMKGSVNTEVEEGTPGVNSSFTNFYFTQCKSTKKRRKKTDHLGCQIYEARQTGQGFDEAKLIPIAPDSVVVAHPAISPDGLQLYFTSDLPGGFGGTDIWMVSRTSVDGAWGKPMNMGSAFNTSGNEMFPYVHADGTVYFSSDGLPGMGGLDIFKATPRSDSSFKVENMRAPVNSSSDDFGITFQAEREEGFFSSNRPKGRGGDDIYWFYLAPLTFNMAGTIQDEKEGKPLQGVKVRLVGSDGSIQYVRTNSKGQYKFMLSPNTEYVVVSMVKGYLNGKTKVSTKGLSASKDFEQIVKMSFAGGGKAISIPNIFYDVGKHELRPESGEALQQLVQLLNDNPQIKVEIGSHTDAVGSEKFNYQLSKRRAQSVVRYLIEQGVTASRLRPKGYAATLPAVVNEADHERHPFLPVGQKLDAKYIRRLTEPQQEVARQINRRTTFRVIAESDDEPGV